MAAGLPEVTTTATIAVENQQTLATRNRIPPADGRRVISVVHLGRPVARGSGGGRNAEVVPLGPMPEEDPDRLPAARAVRLGAMRDSTEGRGPVAGQECECHRHLLDIEQSQPFKPGSPLNVGLRPVLINGQRAFHTKILSVRARPTTPDTPSWPECRNRLATRPLPSCDRNATRMQPSRNCLPRSAMENERRPKGQGGVALQHGAGTRRSRRIDEFSGKLTSSQPKGVFFCPESGTIEPVRSKLSP